jgi:hypothetical protein
MRPKLTYSNVVCTLCLFLLLGGGAAYAAGHLGKNTVGSKQLKTNSVTSAKIKNGAVTGAKINLSSLGSVPNADHATRADTATNAANATTAANATNATNAANAQPVAFAHVSEEGVLDSSNSKNVAVKRNETLGGGSTYCFSGLPFTPKGGQATLDEFESARNAGAQFARGTVPGCPTDTQAFVYTWEGGIDQKAGFYVVFYG